MIIRSVFAVLMVFSINVAAQDTLQDQQPLDLDEVNQPTLAAPQSQSQSQIQPQQPLETPEPQSGVQVTTRNGVVVIEDTIRVSREQPKVLSIVPWQPPRDKATLPSPFVKRIEQDFMPLDREEFTRKVQHFERVSGSSDK